MKVKIYKTLTVVIIGIAITVILSSCNPLTIDQYSNNNYTQTQQATILVYFTTPPADNKLYDKLVDFMDTAKSTIDVAIYSIDEYKVIDELVKKKNEGLTVRIVTDDYNLKKYPQDYTKLKNAHIPIVSDDSGIDSNYIMHDKFVIVDGKKVWTGSTNFTYSGFAKNYNNSLIIISKDVAKLYDREFDQMFVYKKFKTDKIPLKGHFNIDGTKIDVYFGPGENLVDKVIAMAKSADYSLDFDIYTFTYKTLANVIIQKKKLTKGVFDATQSTNEYSQYEYLKDNGVNVKKDGIDGLLHNKVMIIDEGTDSDPMVITGSANWTNSVEYHNDENMIIIHSDKFAKMYYKEFLNIYNVGVN